MSQGAAPYRCTFFRADTIRRVIILGGGLMAEAAVEILRANGIEVIAFMGSRQIGYTVADGSLYKDFLKHHGIEPIIVDRLEDSPVHFTELHCPGAMIMSLMGPFIIPVEVLDLFEGMVFNAHNHPLPQWRGGAVQTWQILAGERRGATCIHLASHQLDQGDVVFREDYVFPPEVRYPKDYNEYSHHRAAAGVAGFVRSIVAGEEIEVTPQDDAVSTYFPRLNTDAQGYIDWDWPGDEIERFVLAFSYALPGASTFARGRRMRIFDCHFVAGGDHAHGFFNGLIIRTDRENLVVACRGGHLVVPREHIGGEGSPRLGDRLHTPREFLDKARLVRPIYSAGGLVSVEPPEIFNAP